MEPCSKKPTPAKLCIIHGNKIHTKSSNYRNSFITWKCFKTICRGDLVTSWGSVVETLASHTCLDGEHHEIHIELVRTLEQRANGEDTDLLEVFKQELSKMKCEKGSDSVESFPATKVHNDFEESLREIRNKMKLDETESIRQEKLVEMREMEIHHEMKIRMFKRMKEQEASNLLMSIYHEEIYRMTSEIGPLFVGLAKFPSYDSLKRSFNYVKRNDKRNQSNCPLKENTYGHNVDIGDILNYEDKIPDNTEQKQERIIGPLPKDEKPLIHDLKSRVEQKMRKEGITYERIQKIYFEEILKLREVMVPTYLMDPFPVLDDFLATFFSSKIVDHQYSTPLYRALQVEMQKRLCHDRITYSRIENIYLEECAKVFTENKLDSKFRFPTLWHLQPLFIERLYPQFDPYFTVRKTENNDISNEPRSLPSTGLTIDISKDELLPAPDSTIQDNSVNEQKENSIKEIQDNPEIIQQDSNDSKENSIKKIRENPNNLSQDLNELYENSINKIQEDQENISQDCNQAKVEKDDILTDWEWLFDERETSESSDDSFRTERSV